MSNQAIKAQQARKPLEATRALSRGRRLGCQPLMGAVLALEGL